MEHTRMLIVWIHFIEKEPDGLQFFELFALDFHEKYLSKQKK